MSTAKHKQDDEQLVTVNCGSHAEAVAMQAEAAFEDSTAARAARCGELERERRALAANVAELEGQARTREQRAALNVLREDLADLEQSIAAARREQEAANAAERQRVADAANDLLVGELMTAARTIDAALSSARPALLAWFKLVSELRLAGRIGVSALQSRHLAERVIAVLFENMPIRSMRGAPSNKALSFEKVSRTWTAPRSPVAAQPVAIPPPESRTS